MNVWKVNRLKRKLTLRQVEKATGFSNAYLSQLENDKVKNPGYNTIVKLTEFYNTPIDDRSRCPNCLSENIKDVSRKEHNGVYGPGSAMSIIFEASMCNECGVLFRLLEKSKPIQNEQLDDMGNDPL